MMKGQIGSKIRWWTAKFEGPSLQIVKCEEIAWVVFKDQKKLQQSGSFSTAGFECDLIIEFVNVKLNHIFLSVNTYSTHIV